ncbi:MAG: lytic murein transglycosylase B [Xanthomonadales bacterium]|nr:lytic murein transglycosylase B [Xanthomonadales bacterium]MDL1869287.1 lytic murein transglycosylase B [Gammaproteobacteria bacterium PRO6]
MQLLIRAACAVCVVIGCGAASARPAETVVDASVSADAAQREFADEVARAGGPAADVVLATLATAKLQPSILEAIARPAEATRSWAQYRPIFITERRIDAGVAFYREHRELIERIAREQGVAPELLVAIMGVETGYGKITGKYRVLDALATLAFHYPPRAKFFRGELKQLFLLGDKQLAYPLDELRGSYAGAMGWGQFMPTSIAQWARDEDDDGRIDLWNSLPDIVASIANYFVAHGWQAGAPVAIRAQPAEGATPPAEPGLDPLYSVQQLEAWGFAPLEHVDAATPASLLTLEGERGVEYWLIFGNFRAITRYNKSPLYAMAVYQLAQAIAAGAATP